MVHQMISRRTFLAAASGAAVASGALAACGGGNNGSSSSSNHPVPTQSSAGKGPSSASASNAASGTAASSAGAVTPPTFVPYPGVTADLPAAAHGVPAGFFHYPADPKPFTSKAPGQGGKLTCMVQGGPPPTTEDKNNWWKALNTALGVDVQIQAAPSQAYLSKFQVDIAGGSLPDIVLFPRVSNTLDILENDFTDLSDHLSGDNVKNYPGLASIPSLSWQIPTINGRIWGVPQSRPAAGQICSYRGDVLKKVGVDPATMKINSGQDFMDLCQEATSVKQGIYALGNPPVGWIDLQILEMMEAPNNWAVDGGKFTSVYESPQFPEMLNALTTMWKSEWINPDMFAHPDADLTDYTGGNTALYLQSFIGWGSAASNPTWEEGIIPSPKWGGGGLAKKVLQPAGYYAFPAIPKTSTSRVKELLDVIDFMAAPFGTSEYLLVNYGVKDTDYTLNGADPKSTKTGGSEGLPGLNYVASQIFANVYEPGDEDLVKAMHGFLTTFLPTGVGDPTEGLYSPTKLSKGQTATVAIQQVEGDIIQGRKKVSEWLGAVKSWQQTAGNAMREEYEKAYASLHS